MILDAINHAGHQLPAKWARDDSTGVPMSSGTSERGASNGWIHIQRPYSGITRCNRPEARRRLEERAHRTDADFCRNGPALRIQIQ